MRSVVPEITAYLEPFRFPFDSDAALVVLTRSQISHGSNIRSSPGLWVKGILTASIEEHKYLARQNAIEYVTLLYVTDTQFALKDYLTRYPRLVELLVEAYPHLRNAFGAEAELSLELLEDQESTGEFEVFGVARVTMSVESGIAALQSFDSGWWLEESQRGQGRLNFTVEYL